MAKLEFTGERVIPEANKNDLVYAEHMCRYLFAGQFVRGKTVLDVASGSGYGSRYLFGRGAKRVVGLDNSPEAIDYASETCAAAGVEFLVGEAQNLPFSDASFDVVVSFETIEHLKDQEKYLSEIKRVLKSGGLAIISTPNNLVFPKGNPFHTKELSPKEFRDLVSRYFKNVGMYYQDNVVSSYLCARDSAEREDFGPPFESLKLSGKPGDEHLYLVAVAGDGSMPKDIRNSSVLFNDNELKARDREIRERGRMLEEIHNSRGWKVVCFLHRLRKSIPILKNL
jgi:ubiquinone/menaquinone biosynthesis C-methylase UbiE